MAIIDDDMNEDSVYSSLLYSLNSELGEDTSPSNDLAWADSCLNTNVNVSSTDWSSIKDVISQILNSDSGSADSLAADNNTHLSISEDHTFRDYVDSLAFSRGSDDDEDLIDDIIGDIESIDISDDNKDNLATTNKRARERGNRHAANVFRPNYTEYIVEDQSNDTGMDRNSTAWELGSSSEDVFQVWDLGISEEQEDFTSPWEKVFNDFPLVQPNPDNSTRSGAVMHVSVDNLTAGMGDLSLRQNTK